MDGGRARSVFVQVTYFVREESGMERLVRVPDKVDEELESLLDGDRRSIGLGGGWGERKQKK